MITQTLAMAVDAYRELHARKLFWITLAISLLVAIAFAAVGIDETGPRIFGFGIESALLNTQFISEADFYRMLFMGFGLQIWLTWVAAILALISTAGIFPELITGGSIDLWLSRPISRWRLFATKFALGLTFVVLQVSVFTTASFFVLGFRGGIWEPSLFLAIPLVTLFFSYLFAICTLFGVLTRSTIAAVLLTLLAWFGIYIVHSAETVLHQGRIFLELEHASIERESADLGDRGVELSPELVAEQEKVNGTLRWVTLAHRAAFTLKSTLPKTEETIQLLGRALIDVGEMERASEEQARTAAAESAAASGSMFGSRRTTPRDVGLEFARRIQGRPVWWVVGTSLLFVGATAGLAGLIFCRRDY